MKYKKTLITLVAICVILIVTHQVIKYNHNDDYKHKQHLAVAESIWGVKYPQLGAIESSTISVPIAVATDSKRAKLIGVITNQYGIRDDILQYILDNVPADNKQGIEASIHLAKNEYDTLYADSPEKARYAMNMGMNVVRCNTVILGEQNKVWRGISDLYRNTPDRRKYANDIQGNVLGNHVYDGNVGEMANINFSDSEQYCKSGGVYWK